MINYASTVIKFVNKDNTHAATPSSQLPTLSLLCSARCQYSFQPELVARWALAGGWKVWWWCGNVQSGLGWGEWPLTDVWGASNRSLYFFRFSTQPWLLMAKDGAVCKVTFTSPSCNIDTNISCRPYGTGDHSFIGMLLHRSTHPLSHCLQDKLLAWLVVKVATRVFFLLKYMSSYPWFRQLPQTPFSVQWTIYHDSICHCRVICHPLFHCQHNHHIQ